MMLQNNNQRNSAVAIFASSTVDLYLVPLVNISLLLNILVLIIIGLVI